MDAHLSVFKMLYSLGSCVRLDDMILIVMSPFADSTYLV